MSGPGAAASGEGDAALAIGPDDPRRADVTALLGTHLAFHHRHSPAEHVHALDLDGLVAPGVTFVSARRNGELVGIGALKELDPTHGELKSMHTVSSARGAGVGRAMVDHLVRLARERGYTWVSLETGGQDAYGPARALYRSAGFVPCPAFADYVDSPWSTCMTLALEPDRPRSR